MKLDCDCGRAPGKHTSINCGVPIPSPQAEREHVAWLRYIIESGKPTRVVVCDSDAPKAFKVYR